MMNLADTQADNPQDLASLKSAVSYWSDRAHKAEHERDSLKNELFLLRKIRRAPVLKPVSKAVLEEFRHVEKWGKVKDAQGNTRANFTTIANNLKISPDTVARQADRLEKLHLIEIHEHAGPQDEYDRKYVHVKEEKLAAIDKLEDTEQIVPKQGGNQYQCQHCLSFHTEKRTVTYLRCLDCHHETIIDDTGYKKQNVQKTQKQLAFENSQLADVPIDAQEMQDAQKQLAFEGVNNVNVTPEQSDDAPPQNAEHSVYTLAVSTEFLPPPQTLRDLPIWVCRREKVPYNAKPARSPQKAKPNDLTTCTSYDQALATYEESKRWKQPYDGIGFMCNGDFTVTDLDHCIEDGKMSGQAQDRISNIYSYSELSPSETGVHIIAWGTITRNVKQPGIEMYDHARFMTWTGKHIVGTPESIEDRQEQLAALHGEIVPPVVIQETQQAQQCVFASSSLTDTDILTKARNGRNSAKFTALWEGSTDGYTSQSEADLALCCLLAYWSDGDAMAIDRLFRQSALYRDKWDRSAGAGATYGERTITQALAVRRAA